MKTWKSVGVNYRRWQRSWLYPIISVVVAVSVCLSTPLPGRAIDLLPLLFQGAQILQLSNLSDRQEVELGQQINDQLSNGEVKFYRNAQVNRYVQEVGQRLAAYSDRPDLPYTFQVVDDKSINAFATGGGFVYVNTGLLQTAENEAELASVIAHEIGHIGGKHLIKQMRQKALASGVATAAGLDKNQAVAIGVDLALNRPRSRQDEFDADRRGLRTLGRAGYAQSGMVSFMQKLLKQGSVPTFLSTHPATSDRITNLKRAIKAQPTSGTYGLDSKAYRANIQPLL